MRRAFLSDGLILGLFVLVTVTNGSRRTAPAALHDRLTRRVEQNGAAQPAGFKIVVVEGEDAVNIVQQKSAVAPVVEVRDRNDQPVAGAVVRFAITRGRATFSGARALTVTTNAAGRAVAGGFTPTGPGALQISASATFQGQTAVAAIAQTNVMTAAEAASVSSAGATGSGAGAGGGGAGGGVSGGGLSATTLGVVGGVAAGGTIVATKVLSGGPTLTYAGPFMMSPIITRNYIATGRSCTQTAAISGTVTAEIQEPTDTVKGTLRVSWSETNTPLQQPATNCPPPPTFTISEEHDFESPANSIQVNWTFNGTDPGGPVIRDFAFSGVLNDAVIAGTIAMSYFFQSPTAPESFPLTSAPVTLTKQ